MGTVALIGIVNDRHPKRVKYTSLMTDGYVSEAGLTLLADYTTTKKVHDLIEQGTIVFLGNRDTPPTHSNRDYDKEWEINKPKETSEGGFYLNNEAAVKYLFDDGEWFVYFNHKGKAEPVKLRDYVKSRFEKVDARIDEEQYRLSELKRAAQS